MQENLSLHQTALMRDCLGVDSQVTESQLILIKNEQDSKLEPFLLGNINPKEEINDAYLYLQKCCRIFVVWSIIHNSIFQMIHVLWPRSTEDRNVNILYTVNTLVMSILVYRSYNKNNTFQYTLCPAYILYCVRSIFRVLDFE